LFSSVTSLAIKYTVALLRNEGLCYDCRLFWATCSLWISNYNAPKYINAL